MSRQAKPIVLMPVERSTLETWARARSLPKRLIERSRIVLESADGMQNKHIATKFCTFPVQRYSYGVNGF